MDVLATSARGIWPAVRTTILSRSSNRKALMKLTAFFGLPSPIKPQRIGGAHSFRIACRNHGSRVHFFVWANPATVIESDLGGSYATGPKTGALHSRRLRRPADHSPLGIVAEHG